jgi:RES domain-containing protein
MTEPERPFAEAAGTTRNLSVPSVIAPDERNYLVNPLHPDFSKINFIALKPFGFYSRLKK